MYKLWSTWYLILGNCLINNVKHSVQFSSVTQSCLTLCDPMILSTPGLLVHHQLLEFTQTHVHWVSDAIQPFHPLSSPSPPSLNVSKHQCLFKWVSSHIRWPKYWSFSFNTSPSNEHPGLISFRMDWLDLLAVQGTLKSLLWHHSSKASTAIIRMYLCFGIWSFCCSFKMKNYAILLSRIANVSDATWWHQR